LDNDTLWSRTGLWRYWLLSFWCGVAFQFLILKSYALYKRSQHVNATYSNIVGWNMLHAFGHRVANFCEMLSAVGSSLKMVKFEPTTPNMSQRGGQTCCAQRFVALACCDRLAGALWN